MATDPKHLQREGGQGSNGASHPETSEQALVQQDTYRKVLFGQAADPLFPPHPEPPEVPDARLIQQALSDVPQPEPTTDRPGTPILHWLLLVAIAIAALGLLFYCRWQ